MIQKWCICLLNEIMTIQSNKNNNNFNNKVITKAIKFTVLSTSVSKLCNSPV